MMNSITRILTALVLILSGCTSSPRKSASSPSPAVKLQPLPGIEDIYFDVQREHNLDATPPVPQITITTESGSYQGRAYVEFNCTVLGTTTAPDGSTVVELKPKPTFDGSGFPGVSIEEACVLSKHRIIASQPSIFVRSKKLAGIPLADLFTRVIIAGTGPNKGQVCRLEVGEPEAKSIIKLPSGKFLATYVNQKSATTFKMVVDRTDDYIQNYPGYLQRGDVGALLMLDGDGWLLENQPAGPGGADYSFLDTKKKRGGFD